MRKIVWSEQARADVRRLDRPIALRLFAALLRFAETGQGDVQRLQGRTDELRLRVGDWRIRLVQEAEHTLRILRVRHRREAYR